MTYFTPAGVIHGCNETLQQQKAFNYKERHAYIHRIRSKYSPAGASTDTHAYIDTKIYYVIRYTTSSFEKAGLLVQFNNDPAGVGFAVDNDEVVADLRPGGWPLLLVLLHDHELLRPVVRPGGWPLPLVHHDLDHLGPVVPLPGLVVVLSLVLLSQSHPCQRIAMSYLDTQGDDDFDSHWMGPLFLDF